MRGQFWFEMVWDERSILVVAIWSDCPRLGCQQKNLISGKVCKYLWVHLDRIHLWMMQVWWPDQLLTFWKSLFFHIFRENRLMVKNQPIVMFVKASYAVSCPLLSLVFADRSLLSWLWWCKLYFSDCRSVFLRWCISQILPGVFLRSFKLYIFLK